MNRRRKIAVVAADIFNDYMNRILVGISEQCRALEYDAFTFLTVFNTDGGGPIQYGEENIFTLVEKDVIDGIVLVAGNVAGQNLVNRLFPMLMRCNVPMVSVDYDFGFCESLYADDSHLMEKMTDHFIEEHGCRHIVCLTGPEGNTPAMTRLEGYKRSMEKHGLGIGRGDIIYGDFWKAPAERLAKEISSGEREMPDAVVCANDIMAKTLCNALISEGIRVPEDILVSGYDDSDDAMLNIPSITTIYPENGLLGAKAVCRLHKLITGEEAETADLSDGRLIKAQSCGCNKAIQYVAGKRRDRYNRIERFDRYYSQSGMLEGLMVEENLDGLLHSINSFTYIINGLEAYMLCLCKNWDNVEEQGDDYVRNGYSDIMEKKMAWVGGQADYDSREFPSEDILPDFIREYCGDPAMYFFLPLHFMDRCFGYSVFRFDDVRSAVSGIFARWNKNISVALEFLRVRTKLLSINQRIYMSSIRDTLTGIYNRKGFSRFSEIIFRKARAERRRLLIIVADLDCLKLINDNFGHMEGDNAITVAANALNSCCEFNEICARTGGDEYALIGCGDYDEKLIDEYLDYIHEYFRRYNSSSGKPYEISLSLGFCCEIPDEGSELERYYNIADERMYEDKKKRKKRREDQAQSRGSE
ncbi:MAG: GGDEF domain-containing protein [Ruminococcus sp.]|nr:GGDEF domain-containing protein [Ruminococcus sp.]